MQSTPGERLLQFTHMLQAHLFERVTVEVGPLAERARLLIAVLARVSVRRHVGNMRGWIGVQSKTVSHWPVRLWPKRFMGWKLRGS